MKVVQESPPTNLARLYDEDFFAWARHNTELLRTGKLDQADIEHIAEEIEDIGKQEQNELNSRLQVLLIHLLKWWLQPEKRSRSWQTTIAAQRIAIQGLLEQSPSLRPASYVRLAANYAKAAYLAEVETGLPADRFPAACPFTLDQALDRDFLP